VAVGFGVGVRVDFESEYVAVETKRGGHIVDGEQGAKALHVNGHGDLREEAFPALRIPCGELAQQLYWALESGAWVSFRQSNGCLKGCAR